MGRERIKLIAGPKPPPPPPEPEPREIELRLIQAGNRAIVKIYENDRPVWAPNVCEFEIEGGKIHLRRIASVNSDLVHHERSTSVIKVV